ncbi:ninjurin-2-like isoform X4 [Toxorhynchites rutilus septentrionalis]|nr:ninjurin-2-like isoform X4 [Toxorhynchites rutilus septentrionalis]
MNNSSVARSHITVPPGERRTSEALPPLAVTPTSGSIYDGESNYAFKFDQNHYDLYRSVIEIALNVSFMAATSNQLRLLISFREAQNFTASTGLVTLSLMMQILIGINLVTIALNHHYTWIKLKAFTSIASILLTVVNILIPFIINFEHSMVDYSEIYRHH